MVYLERLKKLRAAGGLAETGNVDQENVENYSARVKAESCSQGQGTAYSSGVGEYRKSQELSGDIKTNVPSAKRVAKFYHVIYMQGAQSIEGFILFVR